MFFQISKLACNQDSKKAKRKQLSTPLPPTQTVAAGHSPQDIPTPLPPTQTVAAGHSPQDIYSHTISIHLAACFP
jgi:hypothetical protein